MTMLTHSHGRLERSANASDLAGHARTRGAAHLGAIKRFFAGVVAVFVATTAIAGAIALKGFYFLSHFSY